MSIVPDNAQHVGAREEQQDAFGFSDLERIAATRKNGALSVVADGMGGLAHGQEMSRIACRTVLEAHEGNAGTEPIPDLLSRALRTANERVLARARELGVAGETGTTLAAAVIHRDGLHWTSVGDSRIYLFRGGALTRITVDHGYFRHLDRQVANGEISFQDAAEHPERHALTSFLGLDTLEEIDRSVRPFPLRPGDRILLCTDGLHGVLGDDEIQRILDAHPTGAAQALVDAVLAKRSKDQDNVTATLFDYRPEEAPGPNRHRPRGRTARRRLVVVGLLAALAVGSAGALRWADIAMPRAVGERAVERLATLWQRWGSGGGDAPEADDHEDPEFAPEVDDPAPSPDPAPQREVLPDTGPPLQRPAPPAGGATDTVPPGAVEPGERR